MKGSRGGSWGDGVSPAPLGVEGKCGQSSADWWEGHRLACPRFQPRSGVSGEHGRLGRAGAKRGLFIAEVAERVPFTVGTTVLPSVTRGGGSGASCWRELFRLGSSQPKPQAGRRHIADGPQGAASRGASKAKVDPRIRASARGVKWEGHRLPCPKLQPRSGVSASFAETRGVMGAGRCGGGRVSGSGQAGG